MASTTTTTWLCKKKFSSLGKDLEKLCHPLSRLIRIQHLCGICWQPTTDSGSTLATTGSEGPVRATLCVWLWTTNWRNGIGRGKLDEWIMYSCDSIYPVNVATDLASSISCEYQIYYYYLQQNSLWTESEWVGGITRTNEMWHVRKSETIPVAVASIRGGSVKSGRTKSGHVFNILFNTPSLGQCSRRRRHTLWCSCWLLAATVKDEPGWCSFRGFANNSSVVGPWNGSRTALDPIIYDATDWIVNCVSRAFLVV